MTVSPIKTAAGKGRACRVLGALEGGGGKPAAAPAAPSGLTWAVLNLQHVAQDGGSADSSRDRLSSYVQVLVEKHRRAAARLPVASSPSMDHVEPAVYRCRKKKRQFWKQLTEHTEDIEVPDRIEVYVSRGGCNGEGGAEGVVYARGVRDTRVERAARALARPAAALLDELLAVPRLLLQLPLTMLLRVLSCSLGMVAGAAGGAVRTVSEQLLQPALALLLEALVRPPLECVARVGGALRGAARPMWLAAGDALDPLARLLGRLRLVHVEYVERRCSCVTQV